MSTWMLSWHLSSRSGTSASQVWKAIGRLDTPWSPKQRWSIGDIWCWKGEQMRVASPASSSKISGVAFAPSRNVGKAVYVRIQLDSRGMHNSLWRCSGSLEPNFQHRGRKHWLTEQWKRDCKVYVNEEATISPNGGRWWTVWARRMSAALDTWLEMLAALLSLDHEGSGAVNAATVRWNILVNGEIVLHNADPTTSGLKNYGRVCTSLLHNEHTSLPLCPASATYVLYSKRTRNDLALSWNLEWIQIPPKFWIWHPALWDHF